MNNSILVQSFCLSNYDLGKLFSLIFSRWKDRGAIVGLIIGEICLRSISLSLIRRHSVRVLADVVQDVFSGVEIGFPFSHIVIWILVLQSLQNILIFKCNSEQLIFSSPFVQTFLHVINSLRSSDLNLLRMKSNYCFVWMLHDRGHLFKQYSVFSFNLCIPIFQLLLLFCFRIQMFERLRSSRIYLRSDWS